LKCKQTKIHKMLGPNGKQAMRLLQLSGRGGGSIEGELVRLIGKGAARKVGSGTGTADCSVGNEIGGPVGAQLGEMH
jgi:hypothetical protein